MRSFQQQTTTLLLAFLLLSPISFAKSTVEKGKIPVCLDKQGQSLGINATEVIKWKQTSPNQYTNRGHLKGEISKVFLNKNGHRHFEITFSDASNEDTIEIIYNEDFGQLPELELGMPIEACGDYITATAASGPYPKSPNGAILHWVHNNPSGKGHPPGFLMIQNVLYGYDMSNADRHHAE